MSNVVRTSNFVQETSDYITNLIQKALNNGAFCVIGLAGGTTPLPIYEELAKRNLDWSHIYLVQGDERNLPSDHAMSNFKTANDALMSKINIPADHVYRIQTELGLEAAAAKYESALKKLQSKLGRDYLFDILMLGIGNDGHTASLFPGSPALKVTDRMVSPNTAPQPYPERITVTYPVLNASKEVVIMADYNSKKDILEKVWAGGDVPIAHIKPTNGSLVWFVSI